MEAVFLPLRTHRTLRSTHYHACYSELLYKKYQIAEN